MIKFASSIIAKPVILKEEQALVGVCEDLIIDPDTGIFAGLIVREGFGKKNLKTVGAKDIVLISPEFILVDSYEMMGEVDEIVRLKDILDKNISLVGNKVYTLSGTYLGKVKDYTIDFDFGLLSRIDVTPRLLLGLTSTLIIHYPQIISIEKDRIVVDDSSIGLERKSKAVPKNEPEAI